MINHESHMYTADIYCRALWWIMNHTCILQTSTIGHHDKSWITHVYCRHLLQDIMINHESHMYTADIYYRALWWIMNHTCILQTSTAGHYDKSWITHVYCRHLLQRIIINHESHMFTADIYYGLTLSTIITDTWNANLIIQPSIHIRYKRSNL